MKTWLSRMREDLTQLSSPNVYGLRRRNREWLWLRITWTQDRQAWAAATRMWLLLFFFFFFLTPGA